MIKPISSPDISHLLAISEAVEESVPKAPSPEVSGMTNDIGLVGYQNPAGGFDVRVYDATGDSEDVYTYQVPKSMIGYARAEDGTQGYEFPLGPEGVVVASLGKRVLSRVIPDVRETGNPYLSGIPTTRLSSARDTGRNLTVRAFSDGHLDINPDR